MKLRDKPLDPATGDVPLWLLAGLCTELWSRTDDWTEAWSRYREAHRTYLANGGEVPALVRGRSAVPWSYDFILEKYGAEWTRDFLVRCGLPPDWQPTYLG